MSKLEKYKAFRTFFVQYLEFRSRNITFSTLNQVRSIYNNHLKKYEEKEIGYVLSEKEIKKIYKEIINLDNVSTVYKNRIISELKRMIDYAFNMNLISNKESEKLQRILEPIHIYKIRKEKDFYSVNEIKTLLKVIDDEDDKDLMITYIYLGLRISEFIALTWDSYDSKNKTIEINKQIQYQNIGKPTLINKLKTKESYRKCQLNKEVVEILERRRAKSSVGFIFPRNNKNPYIPLAKTTLRLKMYKYMDKAHLKRISPHGFRHTKATMFMSVCKSMAEVKAAAKFLGHSVTMMMETYAHTEEKLMDNLIKRMEM